ncbi:MAG TPA: cytochrome P450 [Gemmatimonadetes bacterium]|nr:cytochrome P450 [Gemmatimonadota bacterium]
MIVVRGSNPGPDYISELVRLNREKAILEDEQILDNLVLLLADGLGNVDKGICNAVAALLEHPDQWELLEREPELLPCAVDECLRFESPAQFIGRVAKEDLEINGQLIRKNEAVLLLLGSANRDPEQFDDPDRFDVSRDPNPHLSFGRSRHSCIGGTLVRLQMQTALGVLLQLIPRIEVSESGLTWQPRMGHRWLSELRVRRAEVRT